MPKGIKWAKEAQDGMRINPAENTGQCELNKRKVHGKPKRGPASTSQVVTWQKQQNGVIGTLVDPQTRSKEK